MSKIAHIHGAHVKHEFDFAYSKFSDLDEVGQPRKKAGIYKIVHEQPAKQFVRHLGSVYGIIDQQLNWTSYTEYRRGNSRKFRGIPGLAGVWIYDRLVLMNDEVLWQWKTGSDLTYRFESCAEAEAFYRYCLADKTNDNIAVSHQPQPFAFNVGDAVRLTQDVLLVTDLEESEQLFVGLRGMDLPSSVLFKSGEIVRVFQTAADGFYISPIDNRTAFRIPKTGGAKIFIGLNDSEIVPYSAAELVHAV